MWQNILKDAKKDILEGLSVLQQNIKPDMLVRYGVGQEEFVFDLNKDFGDFYFGRIRLRTNEYIENSEVKERVVSIIKELRDSDLRDWADLSGGRVLNTLFIRTTFYREMIDIDIMKRR